MTYGQRTGAERRRVRRDLEECCALDTLGMVQIVNQFKQLAYQYSPNGVEGRIEPSPPTTLAAPVKAEWSDDEIPF